MFRMMLHFPTLQIKPLRMCCLLHAMFLHKSISIGESRVIGSAQPIVALAGDDVTLPCHLIPAVSVVGLTVEWSRPALNPDIVHLYRDGRDFNDEKNPSYSRRTDVFGEELQKGNISLYIRRVKHTDEGIYRCFVPRLESKVKEAVAQLIIGTVSKPQVSIVGLVNGGVVLQCESGGWYPEPEVEWLHSEGHVLSAGSTETLKDPDGIYTVRRNVTVKQTATNRFACRVIQQTISHQRETEIHVPGDLFGESSPCDCFLAAAIYAVPAVVIVILLLTFSCYFVKHNTGIVKERRHLAMTARGLLPFSI